MRYDIRRWADLEGVLDQLAEGDRLVFIDAAQKREARVRLLANTVGILVTDDGPAPVDDISATDQKEPF